MVKICRKYYHGNGTDSGIMNINNNLTKTLNENLIKSQKFIINELIKIFGKENEEKIKNSLNNTIIMYTTNINTITNLLNNIDTLDDNTINVLNYYKNSIEDEIDTLNEEEVLIGEYNISLWKHNKDIIKQHLKNKYSIMLKSNNSHYSFAKIDIFDNNSNEDYILEVISNFCVNNYTYDDLVDKYGIEFTDKYMLLRNTVANVISKIIARNLSKKEIHLFSKNKSFDYWQEREELLKYAFDEDLGLILSEPFKFIEKVGVDNLSSYIDNLRIIIETNSIEEINKEEFKEQLDKIRNICHKEIIINEPLIKKQINKLQEKKEKLKSFPKFDKDNPTISSIDNKQISKTLPKLDLSTFNDIANKTNNSPSFQDILNDDKGKTK